MDRNDDWYRHLRDFILLLLWTKVLCVKRFCSEFYASRGKTPCSSTLLFSLACLVLLASITVAFVTLQRVLATSGLTKLAVLGSGEQRKTAAVFSRFCQFLGHCLSYGSWWRKWWLPFLDSFGKCRVWVLRRLTSRNPPPPVALWLDYPMFIIFLINVGARERGRHLTVSWNNNLLFILAYTIFLIRIVSLCMSLTISITSSHSLSPCTVRLWYATPIFLVAPMATLMKKIQGALDL